MIYVRNSEKIKKDLEENGYTYTSAGQKTGYSKAYISSILKGTRTPNPDIAVKLCELTSANFDDYFYIQNVHKIATKANIT